MQTDSGLLAVYGIRSNIFRCVYTKAEVISDESPIGVQRGNGTGLTLTENEKGWAIGSSSLLLCADRKDGCFTWYAKDRDGNGREAGLRLLACESGRELTQQPLEEWNTGGEKPVYKRVHTVDGDRNFVENLRPRIIGTAYRAKLHFTWQEGEQIHGLGQGEEGIFNYRGKTQYLYQHNMRIPMPVLVSDRGYAILADCGSLMTFNDDARGSYLFLETVDQLDTYFIAGDHAQELVQGIRNLTGKAALLPKWAFGYIQSKERYDTQEELVGIAREYRRRDVGLDCVVQDWKTWTGDHWGEKQPDPERFPDLKAMRDALHGMNVHSMVSVWPNMNYNTVDCAQMQDAGFLLHDLATYNAFDPKARELYWKQAEEGLYHEGFDSWWCDSTEPFPGPDWGGETMREPWERYTLVGGEHKKYLGAKRANLFGQAHAKGIYENQRRTDPDHRVFNLTRSGYAGIGRYGAALWSGDTAATWETLRRQLTESLNMAISGVPWWTLDIGGFFVVKENWRARGCGCNDDPTPKWFWHGDFENGLADPGYRELYVRWLQMGVFLPLFRSHGTDVPREIWQFGEKGEPFYDAIAQAIALRYRLMPYIYSVAGSVWYDDAVMQRPLFFDFPEDPKAAGSDAAYMFGPSLLVCPVTEPMYYLPGGEEIQSQLQREAECRPYSGCYLPAGTNWYDLFSGCRYEGGQEIRMPGSLEKIPVFVRAGSILPMEEKLSYACESVKTPFEIRIYPGADACFMYYEDAGDGYGYEDGAYNRIRMEWNDERHVLRIGGSLRRFPGSLNGRNCVVHCADKTASFIYTGEEIMIQM